MPMNCKNTTVTPRAWQAAGAAYPLADLPAGDYTWTGSYQSGEGVAYSCVGFARMVLDATYGRGANIAASGAFTDLAAVRAAFARVNVGDRVTFATRSTLYGTQHAIIVAAKGADGITAYDCNRAKRPGKGYIGYDLLTWNYLLAAFERIKGGIGHK